MKMFLNSFIAFLLKTCIFVFHTENGQKIFHIKNTSFTFFFNRLGKMILLNSIKHFNIKTSIKKIDIEQKILPTCSFYKNNLMKNFDKNETEGNRKLFLLPVSAINKARHRAISIISVTFSEVFQI
jgi:hypothetical protein